MYISSIDEDVGSRCLASWATDGGEYGSHLASADPDR